MALLGGKDEITKPVQTQIHATEGAGVFSFRCEW